MVKEGLRKQTDHGNMWRWGSLSLTCASLSFYHALNVQVVDEPVAARILPWNETSASTVQASIDTHSESILVLPLTDWEIASLEGGKDEESAIRSCQPPVGISRSCCLGAFSMGGDIDFRNRHHCLGSPLMDRIERHEEVSPDSDACRIVRILSQQNLQLAFVGDSMTNQVVQAWICELQKRNYIVETTRVRTNNPPKCKTCLKWTLEIHVSSPTLPNEVNIKFHFIYRVPFDSAEEQAQILGEPAILVVNFGLHWSWNGRILETTRLHYRKSMTNLLKAYKNETTGDASNKLLLWRETSAQHFDADGGDWGLRTNESSKDCVAITASKEVANWRTSLLKKAARSVGLSLNIIPWWNYTAQLWELHPPRECSHYCSIPSLYQPIWYHLRRAMDEKYG